ncbi:MAG TPA: DUF4037 domain-containing protein [Chloroflexota bacterium]|nr:DUF4037 domain-containing protein [Chloroflexota bacterium]
MMNEAGRWRLELARQMAGLYAQNAKVAAMVVAGSVGHGRADAYADIELDIFWHEPPTDAERQQPIQELNAEIIEFWPLEDDEWSEDFLVGPMQYDISNFLVSTIDRTIADVVAGDTAVLKQCRLAGLRHGVAVVGRELIEQWQAQITPYPDALRREMVAENLNFPALGIWYMRNVLAVRQDWLMLADVLVRMQRRMMGALLGLNGLYLAHPGYKWLNETIAEMSLTPPDLAARLQNINFVTPTAAIEPLHQLLEETIALAEQELPDLDFSGARRAIGRRRTAVYPHSFTL